MSEAGQLIAAARERLDARRGVTAPAQAWAVIGPEGVLHASGWGEAAENPTRRAFRIASCTKAFTALTAVLLARDGLLDLAEPLGEALGEAGSGLRLLSPGGRAPTLADALAMSAGFPTDDPWADRQESLSDEAFGAVLAEGVRAQWAAGTRFQYSNLGYAIVGRVLAVRAGRPFTELVRERLLDPLGLTGTAFSAEEAPDPIAGYSPAPSAASAAAVPTTWELDPFSSPGAFSPIGGLFSTLDDLARWVGVLSGHGAAASLVPPEAAAELRAPRTPIQGDPFAAGDAARGSGAAWLAYGLGLQVRDDGAGHRFHAHSGGYPGFTAHLTWEQSSGIGVIALENATYTNLGAPLRAAMDDVFGASVLPEAPAAPPFEPWPETVVIAQELHAALAAGSLGDLGLYDPCALQDESWDRRAASLSAAIERMGGVADAGTIAYDSPSQASWTMRGPTGSAEVGLDLTPRADPRVMGLYLD